MVDKSQIALDTAVDNAKRNRVDGRLAPVLADFSMPFATGESLDLILANPPYVSDEEYFGLDREVLLYEPEEALRGGPEGTETSLSMIRAVAPALKPGGVFLMEIGATQGERFRLILDEFESPFSKVEILHDLAGHDRAVFCYKSGNE
jgi:release factor glutamine methyltransferase